MIYNYAECPQNIDYIILPPKDMLEILKNQRVLFMGDSVVAQEECNLRCLLRDWYIGYNDSNNEYEFENNITIRYFSIGFPWTRKDPTVGTRLEMEKSTLININIGNHYFDPISLYEALRAYWKEYKSIPHEKKPHFIFRLQHAAHFPTSTGEYYAPSLVGFKTNLTYPCINLDNVIHSYHQGSFRYQTGREFCKRNNIAFYDVTSIGSKLDLFHPQYHLRHDSDAPSPIADCLHFAQDSWILSAINTAFLHLFTEFQKMKT
jgi:hypothetical protein